MADISMPPLQNFGALLSSWGEGLANTENANTNRLNAVSSLPVKQAGVQNTNANTALTQAQTAAADLQNQRTQIQLQYMAGMANPPIVNDSQSLGATNSANTQGSTAAPSSRGSGAVKPVVDATGKAAGDDGSDASSVADFGLDPAHIDAHVAQTFAVPDTWTPQEMQSLQQAATAKAVGLPDLTDSIKLQHEARITTATQQAQNLASKAYDNARAVFTAPPGRAFDVLNSMNPSAAEGFEKVADAKNWSDEKLESYVRQYAQEMGNSVHRFANRPIEVGKDGVARDAQTGLPVLGANPAGLSASEHVAATKDANTLVDVPQSDGSTIKQPQWQALHYTSADQYINASASRDDGTAPEAPRTPVPGRGAPIVPPSQQGAAPGQQTQTSDPVLRQALSDPDYKLQAPKVVSGQTPTPAQLDQQKVGVQARTDLLKDSQDATQAAATSLQYLNAAKAIMDSKGATVGAYGGLVNAASKWLPFTGNVDATNYAEVAKYLGNAALAQAKGTYGSRMTQSEVQLQLGELSPSTHMPDTAINNLLATNIAASRYAIDSAQRSQKFLAAGGDPQQFSTWNEKYFPRASTVNGSSITPTRPGQQSSGNAPAAGTIRGGYKFAGGDPANKNNWVKQ